MNTSEIIIIAVIAIVVLMYITNTSCTISCGKGTHTVKEGMTAGLSSINGLAFNNNARICSEGNAMGSSSPYCASVGHVLI